MKVIETKVREVTVFNKAALVIRRGKLSGLKELESICLSIKDLPLCLYDNSIRVKIPGKFGWSVRNVQVEIDRKKKIKKVPLEDKIKFLQEEVREIENRADSLQSRINLIKQWLGKEIPLKKKDVEKKIERKIFPFNAWQAFLEDNEKKMKIFSAELRELAFKKYKLEEEIEITKETAVKSSDGPLLPEYCKNLQVTLYHLSHSHEKPKEIEISYIVPGALWLPLYKLYIGNDYKRAGLFMGARVAQKSGEDWTDAELHFSAATLERVIQLPELMSRRIGRAEPPPPQSFRRKEPSSQVLFKSFDKWLENSRTDGDGEDSSAEELINICNRELINLSSHSLSSALSDRMTPSSFRDVSTVSPCPPPPPPKAEPVSFHTVMDDLDQECCEELCEKEYMPPPEPVKRKRKSSFLSDFFGADEVEKSLTLTPSASSINPVADLLSGRMSQRVAFKREEDLKVKSGGLKDGDFSKQYEKEDLRKAAENYFDYELEGVEGKSIRGQLRMVRDIALSDYIIDSIHIIKDKIKEARTEAYRINLSDYNITSFQCVFSGRGRASVPADGYPHTVDVMTEEGEAFMVYRTIPLTDPQVFKRLTMKNPFDTPLPGGDVQVFLDSSYMFTTYLKGVGKEGRAVFPLGVEQELKVSRNTSFHQEEVGITGGTSLAKHEVEISIRSLMSQPVEVEVIERIPVKDKGERNIDIKILESEPECKEIEFIDGQRIRGAFSWKIDIEPGEIGAVKIGYQILMPSKMEIVGGNRRV